MRAQEWFVHLDGAVLGPLSQEAVTQLLSQNRVQFVDFAWNPTLTKWTRLADLDEFASLIPPYPKVPIPSRSNATPAAPARPEPEPEPAPAPAPAPKKAEPAPAPPPPLPAKKAAAPKPAGYRERVTIRATFVTKEGRYEIINISEGGVLLNADEPLEVGTELKFRIESKDLEKSLDMTGVVIRHVPENGKKAFAVEFTRVNPAHRRILQDYVRSKTGSA